MKLSDVKLSDVNPRAFLLAMGIPRHWLMTRKEAAARKKRSDAAKLGWSRRRPPQPEHASYSTEAEPPYPPTIRE